MKKKTKIVAALIVILAVVLTGTIWTHMRADPKEYHSEVAQADCLLCGEPNLFRNTDALAFVAVHEKRWDVDNIGMVQYCQEDTWAIDGCYYERFKDESLTPTELAHKRAAFDINGVYKKHNYGDFTSTRSFNLTGGPQGSCGTFNTYSKNGLIVGNLNISKCKGADPDYLCSVLCQGCFDRVYPITRRANFFLTDCKTGEIYQVYDAEDPRFDIGDYRVHIQLQDLRRLIFYITDSMPEI